MIANARMYSVAPAAVEAWRRLFEWVSKESGFPLEIVEHAYPASLDDLWRREDLAAVSMCGLPFARDRRALVAIAAPIPAAARYGGRPVYFTDFVVRTDSPFRALTETFGHRIAYTTPGSHSGYNAARHHLLRYRKPERRRLYAEAVGPVVTPRRAVEAVAAGNAEVAPIDSYALDLLRLYDPALARSVRTVESTAAAPIPPLIASAGVERNQASRLRQALTRAPAHLLERLTLSGFAEVDVARYAVLVVLETEAVSGGYPALE